MRSFRKEILNPFLRAFGYEITKVSKFCVALEHTYNTSSDFVFVQIGANDGISFDELYQFVTTHKCRGLVVEPLKDMFEQLKNNYKDYPAIIPVNKAVHPTEKSIVIYRVAPDKTTELPEWAKGIASVDPQHHLRSAIPAECMVTEQVDAVDFMTLLSDHKIKHIDLLQIDVEGFDAEIIKMIDFAVIRPRLIKYEHAHLTPAESTNIQQLLRQNGYRLFRQGNDSVAVNRR